MSTAANYKHVIKTASSFLFAFILLATTAKANIITYQKTKDGVHFTLDKGNMFIHVIGDGVIEVKYTNLSAMPEKKSLVVPDNVALKNNFSVASGISRLQKVRCR